MRKQITWALIAIAALASASAAVAGSLKVEPGLWKITVTSHGASKHGGATAQPTRTRTHCITQKEIDNFANKLAEAQQARHTPDENCQRTSFHETSSAVDWKYACTGKFTMTSEGSIKFDSPSHYTGSLKMNGNLMGRAIDNSSTMEGTRVGACTGNQGGAH